MWRTPGLVLRPHLWTWRRLGVPARSLSGIFFPCQEGFEQILLSALAGAGGLLLGLIPITIHEVLVIRRERSAADVAKLVIVSAFLLLIVLGTPVLVLVSPSIR